MNAIDPELVEAIRQLPDIAHSLDDVYGQLLRVGALYQSVTSQLSSLQSYARGLRRRHRLQLAAAVLLTLVGSQAIEWCVRLSYPATAEIEGAPKHDYTDRR